MTTSVTHAPSSSSPVEMMPVMTDEADGLNPGQSHFTESLPVSNDGSNNNNGYVDYGSAPSGSSNNYEQQYKRPDQRAYSSSTRDYSANNNNQRQYSNRPSSHYPSGQYSGNQQQQQQRRYVSGNVQQSGGFRPSSQGQRKYGPVKGNDDKMEETILTDFADFNAY